MHTSRIPRPSPRAALFAVLAAAIALPLSAQKSASLYPPITTTGTSLEVTADPLVPRPHTKHCEVTLLTNEAFADYNNHTFDFTPPADCPGPWAKVIFTGDFSIDAGVQFDRTGWVFLGGVNIYFGTTAEPLQNQTDAWHVERDLTDYASLFKTAQTGYMYLGNTVNSTYTSVLHGTLKLEFYQADFGNPAPRAADKVLSVPTNGVTGVNNSSPEVTESFTLPTNIESAYIDVIAESQNAEEQWFFCLPNSFASEVNNCGNSAFRQVNVSIDGQPAGVAPVYPWIYTGGVDPGLWIPIPGVQTLNFVPYRVDLTPFAGLLSNGQQHTVGVTVYNAFNFFNLAAALLLYEDHGSKQVTGAVTENTLTAPNPSVAGNVSVDASGNGNGSATVTSSQQYIITGYVNTSHGRVKTTIDGNVNFSNAQTFTVTGNFVYGQDIVQTSTSHQKATTQDGFLVTTKESNFSYPFTINYLDKAQANGDIVQPSTVDQKYLRNETDSIEGFPIFESSVSNEVRSGDTATFVLTPNGYALGPNSGQSSKQIYTYKDSLGNCYSRELKASSNVLNTVTDGQGCHQY